MIKYKLIRVYRFQKIYFFVFGSTKKDYLAKELMSMANTKREIKKNIISFVSRISSS